MKGQGTLFPWITPSFGFPVCPSRNARARPCAKPKRKNRASWTARILARFFSVWFRTASRTFHCASERCAKPNKDIFAGFFDRALPNKEIFASFLMGRSNKEILASFLIGRCRANFRRRLLDHGQTEAVVRTTTLIPLHFNFAT